MKQRKKLLGLFGLALVALMTVVAYFLPTDAAAESTSHTDVIRVTVYDQYPSVELTKPLSEETLTSPSVTVGFNYENANHVNFQLTYETVDETTGEVVTKTINLPKFDPANLDPTFEYASGSDEITIDLTALTDEQGNPLDLTYGRFVLTAVSESAIGRGEDAVEFYYVPAKATEVGTEDSTNDPIVNVEYDEGVAKVELMIYDKNGNPLLDSPIVVENPANESGVHGSGSQNITLPLGSYGLASGDYVLGLTAFRAETDPATGETSYSEIYSPFPNYPISYTQPEAPAIPNTGRLLESLNIATSDLVITSVIVFTFAVFVAFAILTHKKKGYRK
ncbi:hypothetical protein IJH89_02050, partial [Candidatus Saccharibacteria bacterium]|nr:hypothetical protein [Candidatus Saccharibacteria bacterium]